MVATIAAHKSALITFFFILFPPIFLSLLSQKPVPVPPVISCLPRHRPLVDAIRMHAVQAVHVADFFFPHCSALSPAPLYEKSSALAKHSFSMLCPCLALRFLAMPSLCSAMHCFPCFSSASLFIPMRLIALAMQSLSMPLRCCPSPCHAMPLLCLVTPSGSLLCLCFATQIFALRCLALPSPLHAQLCPCFAVRCLAMLCPCFAVLCFA